MNPHNSPHNKIADLLASIGSPARVNILLSIGTGEACVCHLESLLNLRQAYISQQLMLLRKNKIITSRRDGKYIYYRLVNPKILDIIRSAGEILGTPKDVIAIQEHSNCECPKCSVEGNFNSSDQPVSGNS